MPVSTIFILNPSVRRRPVRKDQIWLSLNEIRQQGVGNDGKGKGKCWSQPRGLATRTAFWNGPRWGRSTIPHRQDGGGDVGIIARDRNGLVFFAYSLVSIGDRWLPPSRSDIQTAPEQFQQCMQSTGKDTSEHSFAVQEAKEYAQRSKKRITVQ